jgi:CheY-like chemotaxis protein
VIGPAASIEHALELLDTERQLDGAVLDINLGGERAYPVADALRARAVPFVFATGYDSWAIPDAYASVPRVEKPVNTRALARSCQNTDEFSRTCLLALGRSKQKKSCYLMGRC